jgi:hypothetical protein
MGQLDSNVQSPTMKPHSMAHTITGKQLRAAITAPTLVSAT